MSDAMTGTLVVGLGAEKEKKVQLPGAGHSGPALARQCSSSPSGERVQRTSLDSSFLPWLSGSQRNHVASCPALPTLGRSSSHALSGAQHEILYSEARAPLPEPRERTATKERRLLEERHPLVLKGIRHPGRQGDASSLSGSSQGLSASSMCSTGCSSPSSPAISRCLSAPGDRGALAFRAAQPGRVNISKTLLRGLPELNGSREDLNAKDLGFHVNHASILVPKRAKTMSDFGKLGGCKAARHRIVS